MRDWHQWHKMLRDRCARLVRDAAAIGARWCEIARDAARSVRDGVRSVRVLCVGSRNLHRHTHHTRTAQANTQHTQRLPYKKNGQRFPWGASPCLLYFVCLCCPGTKPWTAVSTDGATTQIWAGRKPSTYENREKRTKSGKM